MSYKDEFRSRISELKRKKPPVRSLEKKNVQEFLCSVCNISFKTSTSLEIHKTEKSHFLKLKKLGLNVKFEENDIQSLKRNAELDDKEQDCIKDAELIRQSTIVSGPKLCVEIIETPVLELPLKSSDVPEGFFDDPTLDAKARNVPFVDKFEAAYEKFQHEIKEDIKISDQILELRWEESEVQRDENELEIMGNCINRMFNLRDMVNTRKPTIEALEKNPSNTQITKNDSESSDDLEPSPLSGWRSKNPFNV